MHEISTEPLNIINRDDHKQQNNIISAASVVLNPIVLMRPRAQRQAPIGGKWLPEEDELLCEIVKVHGAKCWKNVMILYII